MIADGSEQGHTRKNADGRHEYDRGWFDGKLHEQKCLEQQCQRALRVRSRMLRAKIPMGALGMSEDGSTLPFPPWVV